MHEMKMAELGSSVKNGLPDDRGQIEFGYVRKKSLEKDSSSQGLNVDFTNSYIFTW